MRGDEQCYSVLADALAGNGYRLTPQREAVLRVLAASDQHPTVEQRYALARERCRFTGRATVYNTLAVLKDLGAVVELEFGRGGNRSHGRSTEPPAHFICSRCGRIDDFAPADLGTALKAAATTSGYRVTSRRLDFYGECPTCQAQAGSPI